MSHSLHDTMLRQHNEINCITAQLTTTVNLLALSAASPGIAIGLLMWERSHLLAAFESRSAAEPGVMSLAFRVKMTQMSLGFYGQSTNGAVKVYDFALRAHDSQLYLRMPQS
jgi:hypothetical protein